MSILMSKLSKNRLKNLISGLYWYHTIELPNNITTRGVYDHRPFLKYYGFPKSFKNKKVLDVGSSDGFFSFEFERRGAKEVLAVDTNECDGRVAIDPSSSKRNDFISKYSSLWGSVCKKFPEVSDMLGITGLNQLLITKDLLGSKVNFKNLSVYDLNSLEKKYDFVFCGDLIEHLKNPLFALENLAAVTKKSCIISLSSSLSKSISSSSILSKIRTPWTIIERVFKRIFNLDLCSPAFLVKYVGNLSGGAFFHFHPHSFKEALLASGFKKVKIYSEFYLPNLKRGVKNPHAIFHCEV